ncbi:hypothetical protein I2485_00615 [Nesterenkonia sp. E16_7]|uniref:hypothetical protein n=1 Tax=unclassified Nesterenkonia TaxID=2629769 RepID=UPI001A91FA30|nr:MULTISPECIES: hypothetical protein [unclassified Nesterenkonia]MBO0596256.1 hypothetical protein [Nesterenkonia sp. E16_10]MBO0597149.1 hypothetical protein [Nesterenkonia sp. E16_7]
MARKEQQGGGRSWIFWGAGLSVVILVVIVGLLTIPTGSNEAEEPDDGLVAEGPDPSSEPVEPEEEPTEGDAPARCEDMDADESFPTEAPEFAWEDFDGVEGLALPVSDEHGPAVQEDGFWRCFSQTPAGAAFAAPSLFMDFVVSREYDAAVDSPGAREAVPQESVEESAEGFEGTLVRGFRIEDSSAEEATVSVWLSQPEQSADGAYEFTLVWDEDANDWRLDLSPGQAPLTMLSNTSDFTEWR